MDTDERVVTASSVEGLYRELVAWQLAGYIAWPARFFGTTDGSLLELREEVRYDIGE